jgi:hypothetical protein
VRGGDREVTGLNDKEGTVMDAFVGAQTFFIVKVTAYFTMKTSG